MRKTALVIASVIFLAQPRQVYSENKTSSCQNAGVFQKLVAIQMDLMRLDETVTQAQNAVDEKISIYENDPGGSRFVVSKGGVGHSVEPTTIRENRENKDVRYLYEARGQEVDRKLDALHKLKDQVEEKTRQVYFLKGKVVAVQQLLSSMDVAQTSNCSRVMDNLSSEIAQAIANAEQLLTSVNKVQG